MNVVSVKNFYNGNIDKSCFFLHNGQYVNSVEKTPDGIYILLYSNGQQIEVRADTKIKVVKT